MNNIFFEIIAFFYLMKNEPMMRHFKKNFFSEPTICSLFDIVKDFTATYKVEPSAEQVMELVKVSGIDDKVTTANIQTLWQSHDELNNYSEEWLQKSITSWGKWRAFYCGLQNTIAYVQMLPPNIGFTDSEEYITKSANIFNNGATFNVNVSDGHDFFDIDNHVIKQEDTHTSGYKYIDQCLNGGFTKKGLYVFMGAPKVGKSMWLCNIAAQSVKNGYNTIYITLEMSYQLVSQRIGANLFNIKMDTYNSVVNDKNFMTERMKEFYSQQAGMMKTPGRFIIEEFPTSSATASDIECFILKKEAEFSNQLGKPFKFQNVCIDYINIMKDQRGAGADNSYTKIKNICEDVRAMGQRNQWAVISLTQVNRSGQEATDLNMTNVSESSGLVATVDALFGIIQNTPMSASNVYYLKAIALRNSPLMGTKQKFNIDGGYLRIQQDKSEDIVPEGVDLPEIYRSATAHAVNQLNTASSNNGGTVQKKQTVFASAAPSSPMMGVNSASLSTTEYQLQNNATASLFGL